MPKRGFIPKQIISKLREAECMRSQRTACHFYERLAFAMIAL